MVTVFLGNCEERKTGGLGDFVPIDEISGLTFKDKATQTMMRRFETDSRVGVFGLYLGDDAEGEVHSYGEQVRS